MKFYLYSLMVLVVISCNSKPENGNLAAISNPSQLSRAVPSVATATQAIAVSGDCKRVGTIIDKFEQNKAVFERLQNEHTAQEWLKISTKNGSCRIIDSLNDANHASVRFEDWDKDGFKDRINASKWYYEVHLFNTKTNDFSRPIEGVFNGNQWDYDKTRGLKFQFMENKTGGKYELYKISDLKKLVYTEISLDDPSGDGEKYDVEIVNRKGGTDASPDRIIVKTPRAVFKMTQPLKGEDSESWSKRVKAVVEDYWRENEAVFVPK